MMARFLEEFIRLNMMIGSELTETSEKTVDSDEKSIQQMRSPGYIE